MFHFNFQTIICNDVPDNDTLVECTQIGNPLRSEKQSLLFYIVFTVPADITASDEIYTITAWVNTYVSEDGNIVVLAPVSVNNIY